MSERLVDDLAKMAGEVADLFGGKQSDALGARPVSVGFQWRFWQQDTSAVGRDAAHGAEHGAQLGRVGAALAAAPQLLVLVQMLAPLEGAPQGMSAHGLQMIALLDIHSRADAHSICKRK